MSKRSRISNDVLPVELLQRVQSLLPLKDATSTCILSKSWLRAWYTIPSLKLIPPEPDNLFSTDENETNYKKLIHTTLERYHKDKIPIESFHLQLRLIKDNLLQDSENWIRLVVSKTCLKHLSLNIRLLIDDSLTLPNDLFSSQNLITINVKYATNPVDDFRLRICTNPAVINCVSLRVMDFECVIITQDVFHNLLSTCTLLEKIRLFCCEGLKNVKLKNLVHLHELDILSIEEDDFWEINNVSSLRSFRYRRLFDWREPLPFQLDSLPISVTHLHIDGVIIDDSFFDIIESKFPLLESLTLRIGHWKHENMVITSASLKWLTLDVSHRGPVTAKVDAPRLLSFIYTGNIPRLVFPTIVPEQIKLTYSWWEPLHDHSFFLKMRETLGLLSKFEIKIQDASLDSLVRLDIDVDDLRSMVSYPVTDVQLSLETRLDEGVWEKSRFFDALFLICRPSYIKSSKLAIRKMMEKNTADLKDVQLKNRYNGKWEALTSSWKSVLDTLTGDLECKLNWFSQ